MKTFLGPSRSLFLLPFLGVLALSASLSLSSCSPKYDPMGMENVEKLGTRLTDLMSKGTEAYSKHEANVPPLLSDLGKAYDHAAAIKGNKSVAEAWKTLNDEIAAPFFMRWKEKSKMDKDVVTESVKQAKASLAAIKKAEQAKSKKK